ncbi:YjbQ family protein [Candidatus Woesearchaeota archaeon]|nr:YjbQ family protein [Candidatus Woesearchaeota archaeon]
MELNVKTSKRNELVDITSEVQKTVSGSGVKDGVCVVYCPHTTGAITINEGADPDVVFDILMGMSKIVDSNWPYRHGEGNSDAHLKSSIVGCSKTVIIENGKLRIGTWQHIFFCEFDGPRTRTVHVKVIKE